MSINGIQGAAGQPPADLAGNAAAVTDLMTRVRTEVFKYFPEYEKRDVSDPPYAAQFQQGLQQLALQQPKAGDSKEAIAKLTADNRRLVYNYTVGFKAGGEERVYKKLIGQAVVLVRARELMGPGDSQEIATLKEALQGSFTAVFGANGFFKITFLKAMMLGDEEFELDTEW
ncbi:MAG: hypothetical protein JWQ10_2979 [Herbaspirillum sp.]|nr:hypothetical protein [Herbaspirillum sp.]